MDPRETLAHDAEQQRQRILAYEAGLELNVLISEQVFGWERIDRDGLPPYWLTDERQADRSRVPANSASIPPYSTEAGAAWSVVERLTDLGYEVTVTAHKGLTYIWIRQAGRRTLDGWGDDAPTFPLALARAALLATLEARP